MFEQREDTELLLYICALYLNTEYEDDGPKAYLKALRKVVEAHGGMGAVAQKEALSSEPLLQAVTRQFTQSPQAKRPDALPQSKWSFNVAADRCWAQALGA